MCIVHFVFTFHVYTCVGYRGTNPIATLTEIQLNEYLQPELTPLAERCHRRVNSPLHLQVDL